MRVRADIDAIAALLRAGTPVYRIAEQLHVGTATVNRVREALGIVPQRGGKLTVVQQYEARTELVGDGHARWIGYHDDGRPVMTVHNRQQGAAVIAFRMQYGRAPVGNVKAGCDYPGCVAREHVEDRPMREAFAAIFGRVTA